MIKRTKKTTTILSVALAFTLLFTAIPVNISAQAQNSITVLIDGIPIELEHSPIIRNDRVMAPIEAVAEAMGWEVSVIGWTGTPVAAVELSRNGNNTAHSVHISITDEMILRTHFVELTQVLDDRADLVITPIILNGRVFMGVQDLAAALFATVKWNNSTRTLSITSGNIPYYGAHGIAETLEDTVENQTALENELIALVNKARAENGLAPLARNADMARTARLKAREMVEHRYFNHHSPIYGQWPAQMVAHLPNNISPMGENLHFNNRISVQEAFDRWMASPGHRAIILGRNANVIGVGMERNGETGRVFWTLMTGFKR